MIKEAFKNFRNLKETTEYSDIVIVGGGLSGVCAAITAARQGCKVTLIQDRPVLGGNASSEVRLWALGATSHMGNNNRWAREGGIVDEIMVENTFRNKEGNPVLFDTVVLDKVMAEPNISLYLNTTVFHIAKADDRTIEKVIAFNSQNSTLYNFTARQFIDASGDGIVSYMSGVPYRIGAESPEELGEGLAPDVEDYGELLGHTLFFYSKKTEKPVKYVAPDYAIKDTSQIPGVKNVEVGDHGCKLWWFEYGGRKDTIHDTEEIKHELWKVAYGIWNYIKNSGKFTEADYYTLEWVGLIPGKRESRRFEGEYMLKQEDLVHQLAHEDAISFGGWAMDLHPADGVYSDKPSCTQWHTKGVYSIPYRCYVPKSIDNLLLTGRIISASHVAFGSTRVMATCAHGGQAVGMAAAHVIKYDVSPRELLEKHKLKKLQQDLVATGHYIPQLQFTLDNLANDAVIHPSSEYSLRAISAGSSWENLSFSMAQMVPVRKKIPAFSLSFNVRKATALTVQVRKSSKPYNHTPDITVWSTDYSLEVGEQKLAVELGDLGGFQDQYAFITVLKNDDVDILLSDQLLSGMVSVYNQVNKAVSNFGKQEPPEGSGVDEFEFWCPKRRPKGGNMAIEFAEPVYTYEATNILSPLYRPVAQPNAWMASPSDTQPSLDFQWSHPVSISRLKIFLDTDYDHPMETVQMEHHEHVMPFVARNMIVMDENDKHLATISENHQAVITVDFDQPVVTGMLKLQFEHPSEKVPLAVFGICIT
ncbi:FAD-dependent oxidoreductase [Echinicola rosea]|uniref:FAD-dependent oxidoreductase n=1 Tax=Echinicola rosea TaxID=1807691 RepID=A0ABQ1VAK7_9BACT|nr:FAD-dependent oxidoreductase [Echinicola rosea]GGF49297.1 hypothetical protein GCM10011339_42380 [Echinicola rosea]